MTITNLVAALMVVSSCGDCNSVKTNFAHVNVISSQGINGLCKFRDCYRPVEIPLSELVKGRVKSIYFEIPDWYCKEHECLKYINRSFLEGQLELCRRARELIAKEKESEDRNANR